MNEGGVGDALDERAQDQQARGDQVAACFEFGPDQKLGRDVGLVVRVVDLVGNPETEGGEDEAAVGDVKYMIVQAGRGGKRTDCPSKTSRQYQASQSCALAVQRRLAWAPARSKRR